MVSSHHSRVQFCWNGVTGRTASFTASGLGLRTAAHRCLEGAQVARAGG